ncbi:hypothetical protein GV827_22010 [Sulfitobacter sp. JBTF-M27]|uniref:UDP-phosphate N-acetylglucosaminyl 1-phosphate transferase n=1 Tax=Sulfitobacter sediminilitoris TaxID=2698830 RepID=A0A6P0CJ78_9RHOB|nr:MraY family glycosyltransferase [Sulfitobacter sediminilitoris]NEK25045.1 hypothetical protein [Sulfitobacter sediminilitoris]
MKVTLQTLVDLQSELLWLTSLSFVLCILFIVLAKRTSLLTGRPQDLTAVQAMHDAPTPRIGGIAIFSAFALSGVFAPTELSQPYRDFILATSFLFCVGLLEDLGIHISPWKRLLACVIASLLVIWLLGVWLPRLGIPGIDSRMGLWFIGVPVTLLITAGVANGFNLIDGVNGLASGTSLVAALAFAAIAHQAAYPHMVSLALMLAAGIFGFFLLNFPFGLVFLGDAGAYTIGFVLSWFGISILLNAPDASPWAIFLTVFWPIADTLLAMVRRRRRVQGSMVPDRLHVHQLVMRALEIYILGRRRRRFANPLSTVLLAPFVIAPPLVGVLLWDQNRLAFGAVVVFFGLFFGSYIAAFRILPGLTRISGKLKE